MTSSVGKPAFNAIVLERLRGGRLREPERIASFVLGMCRLVVLEIRRVLRLITLQWGEKLVIAVQAEMEPSPSTAEMVDSINRIEASLQAAFPLALWVFFEPDVPK